MCVREREKYLQFSQFELLTEESNKKDLKTCPSKTDGIFLSTKLPLFKQI